MKTLYCAAVDLGATSGRVIVGAWSGRELALTEVHRFPHAFRSAAGHEYWDVPGLWHEIRHGLVRAAASLPRGRSLASVGVDTWGVDFVLTDDAGRLVFPAHCYRDRRTLPGLTRLRRDRAAHNRLYAATGIPAFFYNTSLQLAETLEQFPAIADIATRCLFLPDYFNLLLSGKRANGGSIASTSQLLGVNGEWSRLALDYFGVPRKWLTKPVASGTSLGCVRGLPGLEGTRLILVPGHDTTCAFDAMPANAEGTDILLSSGTWSLIGFESDQALLSPAALAARVANDQTGRGGIRPLVNVIGLWLLEGTLRDFSLRPSTAAQWAALIRLAQALPAPDRRLDVKDPALINPTSMRASIDAQLKKQFASVPRDLAGYVRLICDSLGHGHADVIASLARLSGRQFKRVLMVGGGAKNPLLCQATADAARLPVISFSIEGTAVGNLANQLVALGAIGNLPAFRAAIQKRLVATTYTPSP